MVLVEEDRILLIQRGRVPGRGLWAVPGGKIRHRESMKQAARREMLEETGLEVEVGDVVWVGEYIEDDFHLVLIDFAGTLLGGDLRPGDDADDVRWVPLDDLDHYPLTLTMYELVDTLRS